MKLRLFPMIAKFKIPLIRKSLLAACVLIWMGIFMAGNISAEESAPSTPGVPSPDDFKGPTAMETMANPFEVKARKDEAMNNFPCMDCHGDQKTNPKERNLKEEHTNIKLKHGAERFWCLTCHAEQNRDFLIAPSGKLVDFNQEYRLCGHCHSQREKDWLNGGHGKRMANWTGSRKIYLCSECHNPHNPKIKAFAPNPVPKTREGLSQKPGKIPEREKVWQHSELAKEAHESKP